MGFFENKKFTVTAISILVILNLVLIGLITAHQLKRGDWKGKQDRQSAYLAKQLDFNEQQKASYDSLKKDHREDVRPLQKSINEKRREIFQLSRNGNSNPVIVDSLTAEIGILVGEMEFKTYQYFAGIRNICTPEQLQKLDSLVQNMIRSRDPKKEERRGPPRN